jgi:hypothetical protein
MQMPCADVAQSAEQLFCKQQVIGSSPFVGSADFAVEVLPVCLGSFLEQTASS